MCQAGVFEFHGLVSASKCGQTLDPPTMQDGKGTSRREIKEIVTEIKVFCCLDLDSWKLVEVGRWLLQILQDVQARLDERCSESVHKLHPVQGVKGFQMPLLFKSRVKAVWFAVRALGSASHSQ